MKVLCFVRVTKYTTSKQWQTKLKTDIVLRMNNLPVIRTPYNTNFAWIYDRFMQQYLKVKVQHMLGDSDVAHNLSQGW